MNEQEFIKKLYKLNYGECIKMDSLFYTRVPGGWICETMVYGESGTSTTFIPFVKKEDL